VLACQKVIQKDIIKQRMKGYDQAKEKGIYNDLKGKLKQGG
jgi:hypothetical protein